MAQTVIEIQGNILVDDHFWTQVESFLIDRKSHIATTQRYLNIELDLDVTVSDIILLE